MDQPKTGTAFTSVAKPKLSMADAMRAALQLSSPSPESSRELDMRASYDAINALLDLEAAAEGHPIENLPKLLRMFEGENNVGGFAAMVEFSVSRWQRLVRWRNCMAHKRRLAAIDLSDSQGAFETMEAEVRGKAMEWQGNFPPETLMSGSTVTTGSGAQQSGETAGATVPHPGFDLNRPQTPQSAIATLSPYSTPLQRPATPADQWTPRKTPHVESTPTNSVSNTPAAPSSSPFRPGSAQEYLQQSRTHLMEGHMPHLSAGVYRPTYNHVINGSRHTNGNGDGNPTAHNSSTAKGQAPYPVHKSAYGNLYGSAPAPLPHHGTTRQQQVPYVQFEAFHSSGRNSLAPSQSAQTTQSQVQQLQTCNPPHYRRPSASDTPAMAPVPSNYHGVPQTHSPTIPSPHPSKDQPNWGIGVNRIDPRLDYPSGSQAQSQQRNKRSVVNPYAEFAAEVHRQQSPRLYMPAQLSSPLSHQQQASVPLGPHTGVFFWRQSQGTSTDSSPSNKPAYLADSLAATARPTTPSPAKTKEQLEYEQQLAAWETQKAEKEKHERLEKDRKTKLKDELDAEMRLGNNVLAYRYRDYLKVNPLRGTERPSTYYLSLLANQTIDENDKGQEAMAVRYAKEKWENYWAVQDKATVIKLLQDKVKTQTYGILENLRSGGHSITASDIETFRQTVASYPMPEVIMKD